MQCKCTCICFAKNTVPTDTTNKEILSMRWTITLAIAGLMLALSPPALQAQNTVLIGGGADLTFFYDNRNANQFDAVFRTKGGTQALNLGNLYNASGPDAAGPNHVFDSLSVQITNPGSFSFDNTTFFSIGPEGTTPGRPDLGLRTRFRNTANDASNDIFSQVRFTLDWGGSVIPAGSRFVFGRLDTNNDFVLLLDSTGPNSFIYDDSNPAFPSGRNGNWGHNHFVYGFSALGDYNVRFGIEGDLIGGGGTVGTNFNINFSAVPEPGTFGLLTVGLVSALGMRRRRN